LGSLLPPSLLLLHRRQGRRLNHAYRAAEARCATAQDVQERGDGCWAERENATTSSVEIEKVDCAGVSSTIRRYPYYSSLLVLINIILIINNMNMAQLITFIMGGLTDVDHNNIIDREFGKAALLACRYLDT
jgi:hypothetical protein